MFKPKRPNIRLIQSVDAPPTPKPIDIQIAENNGSTVAIEATEKRMQDAKKMATPSLIHIIEQKTWENGQLRQELAYQQRKHAACMYLVEEVKLIVETLQKAPMNFQLLSAGCEKELRQEI